MVYCKGEDNEMFEDDEGRPVVVYCKVGFNDTDDVVLMDFLDDACDFLEHAKEVGGKVLVHCVVGKSSKFITEGFTTKKKNTHVTFFSRAKKNAHVVFFKRKF